MKNLLKLINRKVNNAGGALDAQESENIGLNTEPY
jgi:hypothetical protein